MAKAAAPKETVEKDKKKNQKQRRRTEEEKDEATKRAAKDGYKNSPTVSHRWILIC